MNQKLMDLIEELAESIYIELDNLGVLVDGADKEETLTGIMFGIKDAL